MIASGRGALRRVLEALGGLVALGAASANVNCSH
jgi:hypothetical protein